MSSLSTTHKADLEALCNHLPDGVVILDSVGRILYTNRAFLQMLGHKTEKIIGESFRDLLLPEDEAPLFEFIGGQGDSKTFPEIQLNPPKGPAIICEITLKGFDTDTGRHVAIFIKKDAERQDLRNALAECETKFKTFFQSAAVYVYFTTEDGKIVDINDAALRLLGYSREELSALTALDLYVDPREREYCVEKIKQQGFVQDCPIHLRRKDGKILSCLDSTVLMEREKGQPALYQGILRDITAQEQLQNALAESEAEYRGFFESAPVFAYLTSKDGHLLETNEAGSRLFGYSTQELRRMNVATLYKDPDDRRLFSEKMRKDGAVVDYPVLLKRKDGRIISCRITASARKIAGEIIGYQGFIRDVTEQEHLQSALIENEKKFRGFFENSAVFAYITDKSGNIIDINSAALQLLGYSRREISELKAANLYADMKEREQFIKEIEQREFVRDLPIHLKRKDGKVLSLRDTAILIRDQQGRPAMYQGIVRDVTEQEQLQTALAENEKKFRGFFENSSVFAYITTTGGKFLDVNEAGARLLGYSKEELLKLRVSDLYENPEDRNNFIEAIEKNRIVQDFPLQLRRKNGKILSTQITSILLEDTKGEPVGFQGIIRDVTEQERLENEMRKLVTLLTQTEVEIVITDTRGTIEYVNPAFEKITGYSAAEARGETPRVLKSDRHDEPFYENLWGTITAGKPWNGRFINKRKDGSLYHEAAHIFPIFNEKGAIQNYAAIKRDITQEVALEEQIQQASQLEAIGRLTGGVAHDFNNVLTIIRGNAETVLKDLGPGDPHYEEIFGILKASQQATRVTNQLLAFSRQQIIRPAFLSANHILKALHTTLKRIIGEDIDFRYTLCESGDTLRADRGQLEQCILNLVVNAQDAIQQKKSGKERKITIKTEAVTVDATHAASSPALPEGKYVVISVSDTGVGMDHETLEKVFEPFFTTKGPERGTGLGCSTVFGIVKQNGGGVQVTSEPEQGSTFTLYWPAAEGAPVTEKATRKTPAKPARGKETILVVEDDPDILKFVSQTLESFGYTVYSAGNGEEALAFVRNQKPALDLLFTDVIMPKMGGEELAETLTRELPQLKIIFSSGYTDKHITRDGILGPNIHFLQKPYGLKALSLKVREVLDKR